MKIAICPGSFDPITKGHLDIIRRAAQLFDRVIVLVSVNLKKSGTFSAEERVQLIRACTASMDQVEVDTFSGLLVDYVRQVDACVIVKGLRALSDFDYEFQQALINKKLNEQAETVFLTSSSEFMFVSSSLVKQVAALNGDFSDFLPEEIYETVKQRLQHDEGKEN